MIKQIGQIRKLAHRGFSQSHAIARYSHSRTKMLLNTLVPFYNPTRYSKQYNILHQQSSIIGTLCETTQSVLTWPARASRRIIQNITVQSLCAISRLAS